jgi:NADPH2:quinone reductase
MMKAAYIENYGPADTIKFGDLPKPEPDSNQVLIKVKAVAVNHVDTYIRAGNYPVDLDFPFIIGTDAAGVVEEVGSRVSNFKKGDRVWTCNQGKEGRQGTFAEYIAVDQDMLYSLPSNVDFKEAIAVIHAAVTATAGIILAAKIHESDTIFVNGGAGSVGSAVIQLAKALGAKVIAAAGTDEKVEWCKQIGADAAFNYRTQSVVENVEKFAPYGIDAYWETSRTPNLEDAVKLMGTGGRIVLMAGKKDYKAQIPVTEFFRKELSLNGFTIGHLTPTDIGNFSLIINRCLEEKRLYGKIAKELKLSDAATAHKLQEETPDLWGKIVLSVD